MVLGGLSVNVAPLAAFRASPYNGNPGRSHDVYAEPTGILRIGSPDRGVAQDL